jgi:hypothetical protein
MGGFFSPSPPAAPTIDTSLQDKQLANMEDEKARLKRESASRMRLLSGKAGTGTSLLRFGAEASADPAAAAATGGAATLGG